MNFDRVHEAQLYQLMGCRYPVMIAMEKLLAKALQRQGAGRPIQHSNIIASYRWRELTSPR